MCFCTNCHLFALLENVLSSDLKDTIALSELEAPARWQTRWHVAQQAAAEAATTLKEWPLDACLDAGASYSI